MNPTLMISVSLAAALVPLAGAKPSPVAKYEWMQPIDGLFSPGQRGRIAVPSEVFGQTRDFPNDLRIVGADRSLWPFFLHVPKEGDGEAIVGSEILNRTWVGGAEPRLEFDLLVPSEAGAAPIHNRLELTASGSGFIRRVEVLASRPGQPDGRLGEGYLIDFDREPRSRNRTVRYPDSDATRLHVRIHANAQSGRDVFDLVSATLYRRDPEPAGREPVAAAAIEVPGRENITGAETRIYDLGAAGRPVEFISVETDTPSFVRHIEVYGRNTELEPWRRVGGGGIHALPGDRQTTVRLRANERFLKVHLFHHDDPPLDLKALKFEAIPRWLVFEAASVGNGAVFYRAWDAVAPRHDLKERIARNEVADLPVFATLAPAPNPLATAQPWRAYAKWLGSLAVGIVALLVVWIIVRMLKTQAKEG